MRGRALLPKGAKDTRFVDVSHYKTAGMGASSESLQVREAEGHSRAAAALSEKRGGPRRVAAQEAFCLWLGFTATLGVLASAGFVLLPRLSLISVRKGPSCFRQGAR